MGCFNKMGFYSHLPITAGDEIMLFICINNSKQYDIDVNMTISDSMFTPICLPICGKYDEYGKIEEIVKDANVKLFEKKIGREITDIINIIYRNNDLSYKRALEEVEDKEIKDYADIFEKLNTKGDISLILTMERKDIYDTMVNIANNPIYNKSYGGSWYNIGDFWLSKLGFVKTEKIDYNYKYILKDYDGDCYIKSCGGCPKIVYDNVEYACYNGIEEIIAKWKEFTGIELKIADEEALNKSVIDISFDISAKFYNKWKRKRAKDTYILSNNAFSSDFYIDFSSRDKFPNDIHPFNFYCSEGRGRMILYNDGYNIFTGSFKKICCDFAKFNKVLRMVCGKYDVSMYGSQCVANSHNLYVFLEINKSYFSVIEKLREKYKDNEEDE